MQQMHFINSYALNKNVFSLFLNVSIDMSGARSSAGRLFHTEVLGQQNRSRHSSFWYVEQSVDQSVQIEVAGC